MCALSLAIMCLGRISESPCELDCAPQLANLYLFYHEYSYMRSLLKTNLCLAKRFVDTVRYIDDLFTLNNIYQV